MPVAAAVQSLIGSFTQDSRFLQLTTPAGPDQLLAEEVHAQKSLSEGFALHISALSANAAIPLKSLIGQPVLLEMLTARSGVRRPFHGHVTQIEMHADRIARRQMEALEAGRASCAAEGTVRTLAPGTTFELTDHALLDAGDADGRTFLVVRARHRMVNNLRADMGSAVRQALGAGPFGDGAERALYRNEIDAIRGSVPYRSGARHPRPTARGQQTAIVVGPPGAVVHTDRDHRIKIQFHWQRGAMSHSRLAHPSPDGHAGAPADDRAGSWVRVAATLAPIAGANWGGNALPRIGQEVLVDFLEGDIDRPVVVGALYNGRGQRDAQHNQFSYGAGTATGNAATWFAGDSGAHAHPAALSGFKSQAMNASQGGAGAYSQLVFDDSPGQARVALQQHASAHRGSAELNLGHLRHQSDNQRLQTIGMGTELKTDGAAALRAGQGMLLSADARNGASGGQLDSREALAQIDQSHQLQLGLAKTAQAHNAKLDGEREPDKLAAIAQQAHSAQVLRAAEREVGAYSEPQLQLSAPAGIAATTPADVIVSASATSSVTAGQDINFASQRGSFYAVKDGISLFTYGKAGNKDKPNQETGVKLHAASGKVISQSQSGETRLTADKAVTVASVTKSVTVGGKEHVLMTAQGAYLKLEGGNIMLHCPGKVEFKASMKELAGPKSQHFASPEIPGAELQPNRLTLERLYHDGEPLAGAPFVATFPDGESRSGKLDGAGRAQLDDVPPGAANVRFGAMPGQFARKDLTPTPNYRPVPNSVDIDALLDKYSPAVEEPK